MTFKPSPESIRLSEFMARHRPMVAYIAREASGRVMGRATDVELTTVGEKALRRVAEELCADPDYADQADRLAAHVHRRVRAAVTDHLYQAYGGVVATGTGAVAGEQVAAVEQPGVTVTGGADAGVVVGAEGADVDVAEVPGEVVANAREPHVWVSSDTAVLARGAVMDLWLANMVESVTGQSPISGRRPTVLPSDGAVGGGGQGEGEQVVVPQQSASRDVSAEPVAAYKRFL